MGTTPAVSALRRAPPGAVEPLRFGAMQRAAAPCGVGARVGAPAQLRRARGGCAARAARPASAALQSGSHTQMGTSRKQNEDRWVTKTGLPVQGGSADYFGIYDGHGGFGASQWLIDNLGPLISKSFTPGNAKKTITDIFLQADATLLQPQGFMGMGARGIGGPKCGSTGLVCLLYPTPGGAAGALTLLSANVGDARAVLVRGGGAVQLSYDHVPDDEAERRRIERNNPNPKRPLVRFVGNTWRVGGLLALSRAFGDAYMKSAGDFEGYGGADDDYSSGFGVTAEPHVAMEALRPGEDAYLVLSSDGLYANEDRGGGGGLELDDVAAMCAAAQPASAADCAALAAKMAREAVQRGTTDDVTVTVVRLPTADMAAAATA